MRHEIEIRGLEGLREAAARFLSETEGRHLIAFDAPMGAGKTTFISAICKALGVNEDAVGSPTFAIVNEYAGTAGQTIFHFDFYRIEDTAEALDIGVQDYFDSGSLCLMEWPENIAPLLPPETLCVHIRVEDDLSRTVWWED